MFLFARLMTITLALLMYVLQGSACTSRSIAMTATPAPLTLVIITMIVFSIRFALMTETRAQPISA
jgi:hypothetical protein